MPGRADLQAGRFGDDHGLGRVAGRHDQPPNRAAACPGGDRQHAPHRPQRPVERQLADEERAVEGVRIDDAGGAQHADGDRDVEGGPVLAQVGGRQVDGDPARRQLEPAVVQRAADPDPPLADAGVGEPDDVAAGQADRHVDLDVDGGGLDPDHRGGGDPSEHAAGLCEPGANSPAAAARALRAAARPPAGHPSGRRPRLGRICGPDA